MRPRKRYVAVGICLVAGAALVARFVWLPSFRPALQDGEIYGVDVSAHQGEIDWPDVRGDDIAFAYVKATEGSDFVDARFHDNWTQASTAGVKRGAYHFFTLCSDARTQAENFIRTVPVATDALPPAIDLELAGNCSARPPGTAVAGEVATFAALVEQHFGAQLVYYVGADFADEYQAALRGVRRHWRRRIVFRPRGDWLVWQVSGVSRVAGINGGVDLDVARIALVNQR